MQPQSICKHPQNFSRRLQNYISQTVLQPCTGSLSEKMLHFQCATSSGGSTADFRDDVSHVVEGINDIQASGATDFMMPKSPESCISCDYFVRQLQNLPDSFRTLPGRRTTASPCFTRLLIASHNEPASNQGSHPTTEALTRPVL